MSCHLLIRRWPTAIGLAAALAGPPLIAALSRGASTLTMQVLWQCLYCAMGASMLLLIRYGERLPLSSVGLRRPTVATIASAVAMAAILAVVLPMLTDPLVRRWAQADVNAGVAQLAALPMWFRIVLSLTGGAIEELLYRGYLVERLSALTSRRWLGAVLAVVVFAAAHIPAWGFAFALIADLPAGVVLLLFYLWRRDLAANMLAHAITLLVAMFSIVP